MEQDDIRNGVGIGFCTFRRVHGLKNLLDHIQRLDGLQTLRPTIVVVDNDGRDPEVAATIDAFREQTGIAVSAIVETKPGISAARNAVFAEAERLNLAWLAMLDDDEWPSPEWLEALFARQAETGAAVVGGPVRPVFPEDRRDLNRYARFWSVDGQMLQGRPFVFCTCNFLVDLTKLATVERPLFDEEFGLSGGGDTVFFRRLFFLGFDMAWAPTAILHEEVPPARASFGWLRQRRFRVGNHAVRWEVLSGGRLRSVAKTVALTVRLAFYPLLRREPDHPMTGWLVEYDKVRGRWASHFGTVFMEYARPKAKGCPID